MSVIRSEKMEELTAPIQVGADVAIVAQMGNIAYKLGRRVYWNEKTGNFGNDTAANALMKGKYHNGWKLPKY